MAALALESTAMNSSRINLPVAAAALGHEHRSDSSGHYPRLFRVFAGSIVAAVLSAIAALASYGDKGLHPAPFIALATLLTAAAAGAFSAMLVRLVTEAAVRWWKR